MKSVNFLKTRLKDLVNTIGNICIRYQFDDIFYNHIIEIAPEQVHLYSESFQEEKGNIISEFLSLFPGESIVFVGTDDLISVTNPIFEVPAASFQIDDFKLWLDFIEYGQGQFVKNPLEVTNCEKGEFALAA